MLQYWVELEYVDWRGLSVLTSQGCTPPQKPQLRSCRHSLPNMCQENTGVTSTIRMSLHDDLDTPLVDLLYFKLSLEVRVEVERNFRPLQLFTLNVGSEHTNKIVQLSGSWRKEIGLQIPPPNELLPNNYKGEGLQFPQTIRNSRAPTPSIKIMWVFRFSLWPGLININ